MKRQVSIVYFADGKTELGRIVPEEGNREFVKLSDVPDVVQKAHLAAEDRTFYANNGISIGGILRAVKTSVTGEAQVGGSTITQQLVKNYYLSSERTISRKATEILLAVKIDKEFSKNQILERYLNSIYYGRGAYGIQTAAKAYFGKPAAKLTVAEGAVLASVINGPSLYDPAQGEKAAANLKDRFNYVLNGMVEENWLSATERAKITKLPAIQKYTPRKAMNGTNGYIMAEVEKELPRVTGLSEDEVERGGLRIVTTIDAKAQANAVTAMNENLVKGVQGGLVAIKPGDGAVLAMYGGSDYAKRPFNNATQTNVQGGSNFKPFAVLGAVRTGLSTKTRFNGNSPQKFDLIQNPTNNYDHRSYGMVDMRRMIGSSINTAFVALNEEIGPKTTSKAAIDAGIPANTPGINHNDLTNVLGTASPHVIDMASAYSTIASQGIRSKPYLIKSATSSDGLDYKVEIEKQRAFQPDVTADVTDAMTYTVKKGGTATRIARSTYNGGLGDRPVAGKTGTSEENKSKWFSGFVPQIATSVLIYHPDANGNPQELTDEEAIVPGSGGATVPAQIWLDFMRPTLEGVEVMPFPDRAGIGDDEVKLPTTTTTAPPTTSTTVPPTTSTAPPTTQPTKTPPGKPTDTTTTGTPSPTFPTIFPPTSTSTKPGGG